MKQLLLLTILLSSFFLTSAQNNTYGFPFIKNYQVKEYKAGTENWAIIKDKRGVIYFGNDEGVLEYDGVNWNLIQLNNKAIVRSLAIDSSGIIYVGGDNEFGYLQADKKGKLFYTSLSDSLDNSSKDFSEINNIFATNSGIYFCSKLKIYKYLKNNISVINLKNGGFISFYVNNNLYNGSYYLGLLKIVNDSVISCKGGDFYIEKDILGIIPYKENQFLISTREHTLYIYIIQKQESLKTQIFQHSQY